MRVRWACLSILGSKCQGLLWWLDLLAELREKFFLGPVQESVKLLGQKNVVHDTLHFLLVN